MNFCKNIAADGLQRGGAVGARPRAAAHRLQRGDVAVHATSARGQGVRRTGALGGPHRRGRAELRLTRLTRAILLSDC